MIETASIDPYYLLFQEMVTIITDMHSQSTSHHMQPQSWHHLPTQLLLAPHMVPLQEVPISHQDLKSTQSQLAPHLVPLEGLGITIQCLTHPIKDHIPQKPLLPTLTLSNKFDIFTKFFFQCFGG